MVDFSWSLPDPLVVWGLFPRALGIVYLIAFGSLATQVIPAVGEHGIEPLRLRMERMRRDFPTWRRFFYFPTLLWVSHRDWALRGLCAVGFLAAAVAVYGGPYGIWALVVCYVCFLSLDSAMKLAFPWDCMLFEAGFFAMFLAPTHALPEVAATAAPPPIIAWAYRLLLFRVLFGFGKFKFLTSRKEDRGYLYGFFINQPLPSPIGWFSHRLPLSLLKFSLVIMFVIEIFLPFGFFLPHPVGALSAVVCGGLMLAILASGSFGYFNLIVLAVCITLFDATTPTQLNAQTLFGPEAAIFTNAVVALHTLGALMNFPLNSYVAQCWHHWPVWLRLPFFMRAPVALYRALHPFRWLHPYGVFPPKSLPPAKYVLLFEVSWDGEEWLECDYKYAPSHERSAPRFVAPHHPRSDQNWVYDAVGFGHPGCNGPWIASNWTNTSNPYGFSRYTTVECIAQRLLEGREYGNYCFDSEMLPRDSTPPRMVRVTTQMLTPTTIGELRRTGRWWNRAYIGPHLPPTEKKDGFYDELFLPPEQWHPEEVIWKRRSRLGRMTRPARRGEDLRSVLQRGAEDLDDALVDEFWNDFIPALQGHGWGDWDRIADASAQVRARFGDDKLRRFEVVAGLLSSALLARLEPHFFGFGRRRTLRLKTYAHLTMLVQQLMGEGEACFESIYRVPTGAEDFVDRMNEESGRYLDGIFHTDALVFQAQKLRCWESIGVVHGWKPPGRLEAAFWKLHGWLFERMWGFVDATRFYRDKFRGERFERGYPERYPVFELDPKKARVELRGGLPRNTRLETPDIPRRTRGPSRSWVPGHPGVAPDSHS